MDGSVSWCVLIWGGSVKGCAASRSNPSEEAKLIGRFETACIPCIPLVAEFSTDHIEKAVFVTSASIFSETVGGMKLKFGEEIKKKLVSLKWRRSRLTAAKLQALSPFFVLTVTGQK